MSPALAVLAVPAGPATVQDLGREGWLAHGVAPGGALVPELLALANDAVGNPVDAAGLELFGGLVARLSSNEGRARALSLDGAPLGCDPDGVLRVERPRARRVQYLAVQGGLATPAVLGGRGTAVSARFGGLDGRPLRTGDALPLGDLRLDGRPLDAATRTALAAVLDDAPLALLPPPEDTATALSMQAYDALCASALRIDPRGDRAGQRLTALEGPALALRGLAAQGPSQPMARGAVELPPDGAPLVLGPEHPVTGGYPLVGVLARAALGALYLRRPGAVVRFAPCRRDEARDAWLRRFPAPLATR